MAKETVVLHGSAQRLRIEGFFAQYGTGEGPEQPQIRQSALKRAGEQVIPSL